jgi:hypothetical protein
LLERQTLSGDEVKEVFAASIAAQMENERKVLWPKILAIPRYRKTSLFVSSNQPMKKSRHHAIREVLRKTPEGQSLLREEQLAKVQECQDIVHDWDDPDDFSLWREVFASSLSSSGGESSPSSAQP